MANSYSVYSFGHHNLRDNTNYQLFVLKLKECYTTIFVKRLKNAHRLATHIYEKGCQALADVIAEVERLQAAQQLAVKLIPTSTVNVMSHEEEHCFQCQESGHIACQCPNV